MLTFCCIKADWESGLGTFSPPGCEVVRKPGTSYRRRHVSAPSVCTALTLISSCYSSLWAASRSWVHVLKSHHQPPWHLHQAFSGLSFSGPLLPFRLNPKCCQIGAFIGEFFKLVWLRWALPLIHEGGICLLKKCRVVEFWTLCSLCLSVRIVMFCLWLVSQLSATVSGD